jgi:hypothetical protein
MVRATAGPVGPRVVAAASTPGADDYRRAGGCRRAQNDPQPLSHAHRPQRIHYPSAPQLTLIPHMPVKCTTIAHPHHQIGTAGKNLKDCLRTFVVDPLNLGPSPRSEHCVIDQHIRITGPIFTASAAITDGYRRMFYRKSAAGARINRTALQLTINNRILLQLTRDRTVDPESPVVTGNSRCLHDPPTPVDQPTTKAETGRRQHGRRARHRPMAQPGPAPACGYHLVEHDHFRPTGADGIPPHLRERSGDCSGYRK